ncbi:hypothetical protein CFP56_007978 [Quercus suber]|uniref:Uncharacterized protein n=1 Tax=Quercus suber TaxID=58331 RepID=A0AAW0L7V3_QUESU
MRKSQDFVYVCSMHCLGSEAVDRITAALALAHRYATAGTWQGWWEESMRMWLKSPWITPLLLLSAQIT